MSSVAKIAPGGYRLFLAKPCRLALTRLLADKPELSQGKALNQLIETGLKQLGYLADPLTCKHEYEWIQIDRELAKRFACKKCLARPEVLPKNILYYPGLTERREVGEDIPLGVLVEVPQVQTSTGKLGGEPVSDLEVLEDEQIA